MNEKGQLLSYDAILAVIILFTAVIMTSYVLGENVGTSYDYNYEKSLNTLEVLEEVDGNILLTLSYSLEKNDTEQINRTLEKIKPIIETENLKYKFKEISQNKTLLSSNNINNTKQIYSSRKTVNEHVFELDYYA